MSFYTDVIAKSASFQSTNRINDMNLLEPITRAAVQSIIRKAADRGIQFMAFETYRSQDRQTQLFKQGATKLKTVGVHHYGLACDLVRVVDGKPNWVVDYSLLQTLAREDELIWGGDWGNPDMPHTFVDRDHVQRCSLSDQKALFAGTWYPDDSYNPYKRGVQIAARAQGASTVAA